MLFLFEEKPIFLTIKERELEKFKKHTNILISIYRHGNQISEKIKKLRYEFMKHAISEEEFRKKLAELELSRKRTGEIGKVYDGYRYFSYPLEILADLKRFCETVHEKGIVIMTIIDEMILKDKNNAFSFIENALGICQKHKTPLLLTLEKGIFSKEAENRVRSYAEFIFDTELKEGKRFVSVKTLEKVFNKKDIEHVSKDLNKFLSKVGFIGEK